ncbi:E3 ubiquitin-protein ligase RNF182-like [Xenopus laevis]|uniref:E3 ubiquitin-protein ligase RNF182-like n=1 Tax=Xenopus laevis TaxID=8355 RepID=A0A8J1MI89_XENLA|nr:E3 ubiquitin-protein ligase RNF182-like [Xenopus laevis]
MEECGICCYEYGQGREAQALKGCVHVICASCLLQMVDKSGTVMCPYCRAISALPSDQLDRLCGGSEKGRSHTCWLKRFFHPAKRHQASRGQGHLLNRTTIRSLFT